MPKLHIRLKKNIFFLIIPFYRTLYATVKFFCPQMMHIYYLDNKKQFLPNKIVNQLINKLILFFNTDPSYPPLHASESEFRRSTTRIYSRFNKEQNKIGRLLLSSNRTRENKSHHTIKKIENFGENGQNWVSSPYRISLNFCQKNTNSSSFDRFYSLLQLCFRHVYLKIFSFWVIRKILKNIDFSGNSPFFDLFLKNHNFFNFNATLLVFYKLYSTLFLLLRLRFRNKCKKQE